MVDDLRHDLDLFGVAVYRGLQRQGARWIRDRRSVRCSRRAATLRCLDRISQDAGKRAVSARDRRLRRRTVDRDLGLDRADTRTHDCTPRAWILFSNSSRSFTSARVCTRESHDLERFLAPASETTGLSRK